ncbi:MAG: 2,3-bisphosphoglycerate-independent phosphoglycerate mutase [Methanobacteriota archaeon]|nr:MAG: 2,3-bisphosphoglycerate-independent phosphoglycerate mutase [Euryarchaeota archaeon]
MRTAFIIMDGLGDLPSPKSPLAMAKKDNMDFLAEEGMLGMFYALGRGVVPGSDTSHLIIFGYGLDCYPGRGPIEALGAGVVLKEGDVAFRTNFATVDSRGAIVDRRAGRIATEEAKKLEKLLQGIEVDGYEFIFKSTVEHRGVLVIRGDGLSSDVGDTDPHRIGIAALECMPKNEGEGAKKTAHLVNYFIEEAAKRLQGKKANYILVRGAGEHKKVESFSKKFNTKAVMAAGGAMYKGVARYVGMEAPDIEGTTGDANSNYGNKADYAIKSKAELAFIHIKATDSYGHDGNCIGKRKIIERVDTEVVGRIREEFDTIIITGDHATPCSLKRHSGHGAPLLAYGSSVGKEPSDYFSEIEGERGALGHIEGLELNHMLMDWMGKSRKVGS